jgi:arginyl-tRNA synthetase
MRLEMLLKDVNDKMYEKIVANGTMTEEEAKKTAATVALSAVKYGDLSNQASKDYIFDIDRFTSFEGNTGPYILYTIVRIKSILNKYKESGKEAGDVKIPVAKTESEKKLYLELAKFNAAMRTAYEESAPHKLCAYIYDLSNALNHFYHETKILAQEDETVTAGYIKLLELTKKVLEQCIDLLGFSAPDRM